MKKILNPYIILVSAVLFIIVSYIIYRLYKRFFQLPVNAEILEYAEKPKKSDEEILRLTTKMNDAISGIFTLANSKNKVAKEIMECNDNDIIRIYNLWNEKFNKGVLIDNGSLYVAMSDEKNTPFVSVGERNYWDELIARLERLKLS